MGLRGPIAKETTRGHHAPGRQPPASALAVVESAAVAADAIPTPPDGLSPAGLALWDRWWPSRVAAHWARDSDLHVVVLLALATDEAARLTRAIRKAGRLTRGSTGQVRLSPLYAALDHETKTIERCEDRLGITPMGRLRLGLLGVKGALTAAQLNAMVD